MSWLREELRKAAELRNEAWRAKSPKEQLEELDKRLGPGVGAKKQRARLEAKLKGASNATA